MISSHYLFNNAFIFKFIFLFILRQANGNKKQKNSTIKIISSVDEYILHIFIIIKISRVSLSKANGFLKNSVITEKVEDYFPVFCHLAVFERSISSQN